MSRRVVIKKKKKDPLPCQVIVSSIYSWVVFRCSKPQHKMIVTKDNDRMFPVCKEHYDNWLKGGE